MENPRSQRTWAGLASRHPKSRTTATPQELDKNWTLMTNWNLEAQLGSVAEVVVGTGVVDHQSLLGVGSDPQQRNTLSKS